MAGQVGEGRLFVLSVISKRSGRVMSDFDFLFGVFHKKT